MAPKKAAADHWSFLEEIEAPMWLDLTLETQYGGRDVAEEWFDTTHMFHQCSSRQLKSGFSRQSEGRLTSEFDLQEPYSPKLPSSVSRSRGKDYRPKKLGHDNSKRIFPEAHPLKDISAYQKPGSHQETKLRETLTRPKGSSISRTGLVRENMQSSSSKPNDGSRASVSGVYTSSTSTKASATNSQSIVTSESSQLQQQNTQDISSRAFSKSSGLLEIARRSLRKSFVTRQASRIEIRNDVDQGRGSGSSSGISSVGSSPYPGCAANSASSVSAEVKDVTPDSRNVSRTGQTDKTRSKSSNVSKAPSVFQQGTSRSVRGGITASANPAGEKAEKLKVQQSPSRKPVHPPRVKIQHVLTSSRKDKAATRVSSSKCVVSNGKENIKGHVACTKSYSTKNSALGGVNVGDKGKSRDLSQPCGRRVLADSKVKAKPQQLKERLTKVQQL